MEVHKLYVGNYKKISDTKKDVEKLKKIGLTPYVFAYKGDYSILVTSSVNQNLINETCGVLRKKGFDAFVD